MSNYIYLWRREERALDRSQEILDLCDKCSQAVKGPDGNLEITGAEEAFRLRSNGIFPHQLSHRELEASCIGLTRTLLRPNYSTIIDFDHQLLWAWSTEVLAGREATFFQPGEDDIKELLGLVCRASLATSQPVFIDDWEERRRHYLLVGKYADHNAQELITHSHKVMAYLSFPLLEALTKKACASFVAYDGSVKRPFPRYDSNGNPTNKRYTGGYCSSLKDLLWLLFREVAGNELTNNLSKMRDHIARLDRNVDPFSLIYRWRNSSLHGETMWPTIGGTVFGIAILVSLDAIRQDFEALKTRIMARVKPRMATDIWTALSYYPPYRDTQLPV